MAGQLGDGADVGEGLFVEINGRVDGLPEGFLVDVHSPEPRYEVHALFRLALVEGFPSGDELH